MNPLSLDEDYQSELKKHYLLKKASDLRHLLMEALYASWLQLQLISL